MSHTKHLHSESHERDSGGQPPIAYWKRAHRDWKFWIALCLMLIAMVVYVLTLDLSVKPNEKNQPQPQQAVP